jgi:cyanophycin synthetase
LLNGGEIVKILSIQSFPGKNIFSHKPVVKMLIDIYPWGRKTTKDIKGFNTAILEIFPGLSKHFCSLGCEGGFVERMRTGTYMGHVIEHLILELQSMLGYDVYFGQTRVINEPSVYRIAFEYMNERVGIECARVAVNIACNLARVKKVNLESMLQNLKAIAVQCELGPSAKAIYNEAQKRGIPVMRLGEESLMQLGYGKYSRLVEASLTDATSCISVDIVGNKHLTKQILSDNGIPVPPGDIAYTEESAVNIGKEIGYPLVVKPYNRNQGKGVTLNIINEEQLKIAYREALKFSSAVIIEKFIKGKDYRVLVVGNKISAVSERRPPSVKGDGIHTIKELVNIENENLLRGQSHEKPLTRIKLDSMVKQALAKAGLNENYIPGLNEVVKLRDNGNLSTGGTARDCTKEIHPFNSMISIKAAKILGLDIAGIDITAKDISLPISPNNGAVVEINAAPGLRMHIYPTEGESRDVAADIIEMMFPQGRPYSIPIISITGTNGKTTTTRLVSHVLKLMGIKVGMTCSSGTYIGNYCISKGDNTGPVSARFILSNKEVEAAVLETARGGIIKKGLGYDMADVGIIINISEDHLGSDNIKTIEDLAFVKSLVIEAIKPEGYAVLNADDKMTGYFLRRVKCRTVLFSKGKNNPLILEHSERGERVVYVEEKLILIRDGIKIIPLINIEEIPVTLGGLLECNIENSLAAIASLYSLNVPIEIIRLGLKSFKSDHELNPGRFNIFHMGSFKIMLDYGHNPAGYSEVLKFIKKIKALRYVGVIGMPGDRLEKSYEEVGKMCSEVFSRIYIKEDEDLRGRKPGEVAGIFYRAAIENGMKEENVEIIRSELRALEKAVLNARPGDFIVMFCEKFEAALKLINKFKKEIEKNSIQPEIAVKL